ncbi:hypothetical protein KCU77_g3598, partial [Aureobasidium melanogenum]
MPLTTYNWTGVQLNISQTVDYSIEVVQKAADEGAGLISFPELWFPGFPKGNAENNWTVHYLPMYINNSLVVGDDNWDRLIAAIQDAGIYAGLSFSELKGDRLYMAQALVVTTPRGRMGMLECGEHTYPSTNFIMQAQMENVHLAPYPYLADPGDPTALWWEDVIFDSAAARAYAVYSGAYVFFHAIGAAAAFDSLGNTMLGVLQQIVKSFPAYIPREEGILVAHREQSVEWLLSGALTSELGATLNYGG